MKMKFRAEPKDVGIFLAFSVILFLLICLAVSNVGLFLAEGELSG